MDAAAFVEAAQQDPLRVLVQRFVHALFMQVSRRLACAAVHPISARYSRWLLLTHDRMGDREFPLTQESLAQMLGVRRASVTTAAGALQEAGFIRYSRGRIAILDREGLENAACECYRLMRSEFDRLLPLPGGPAEVRR
jgi:CRP-like cAMP-binding protein